MQISGANLLIASQQAAKVQTGQATQAGSNFMAALAKSKADALFAPLDFKAPENTAAPSPAKPAAQPSQGSNQRPGANLDIRI
ncbi:MAG TPA: hypothetical protein VIJ72_03860 [Rhizomicrobium sp.]